jgi:uncharacterized protein (TIRG00374 family)
MGEAMNRSINGKVILGLILAIIVYAGLAFVSDIKELAEVGSNFNWLLFPVVLGLALGNYLMRLIRWHMYLRAVGVDISVRDSAVVFFAGLGMSVSPGKLGELLKAQYVKNINETKVRVTAPVVIAERLTDLIGVILIAATGVFIFNYGFLFFAIIILAVGSLLLTLSSRRISLWLVGKFSVLPPIRKRREKLEGAVESMATLNRSRHLFSATLLSVLAWGFEGVGFYLIINSFPGVALEFYAALFIYAFSILIGAVSMIPGGLGVTEGAMTGLMVLLNVPKATAFAATLLVRLATLWFAVVLGLVTTAVFRRILEPPGKPTPGLREPMTG